MDNLAHAIGHGLVMILYFTEYNIYFISLNIYSIKINVNCTIMMSQYILCSSNWVTLPHHIMVTDVIMFSKIKWTQHTR